MKSYNIANTLDNFEIILNSFSDNTKDNFKILSPK